MSERQFKCNCCGQPTRKIGIEDPRHWLGTTQKIRVHGSYFTGQDTGEVRTVSIGDKSYQFLRAEVREHWPELERLIVREDMLP
jgi:hypothetical protein